MEMVELFAGIGGFHIAATNCGHRTIWANDIEPLACKVYRSNFSNIPLREGDIREIWREIPEHDLMTAGFPCQPFSSAGKKQGIRDPRGTLFQVIIDVLKKHEPKYFILENVKRLLTMEHGKHFATIIFALSELNYKIEWRLLNAKHFSLAQNRERLVIIGEHITQKSKSHSHDFTQTYLTFPDDLVELSDKNMADIAKPLFWKNIEDHGSSFGNWGIAQQGKYFSSNLSIFSKALPALTLESVLQNEDTEDFDLTESTLIRLDKNASVDKFINDVEVLSNQRGGARMGYTIFGVNGIAPTLTASTSRHYERYKIGDKYRRLTNIEYARLQGFPDNHCREVKVYDQYVLLGNAVPPPMIHWVMKQIETGGTLFEPTKKIIQKDFFAYA